ncbi:MULTISPECIES: hypothetical protein [Gordonia]|uniref:DUF4190 domain-containing protein n=1 Tax=Gordonia amicalis TaxID=89053 RepID=A0ABU4DFX3_9ACTN|nr:MULTISPECIES: hypothetical protein [Gordonia]MBA5848164.1 hypothetical protein [Gordonia amicalis]MCZ0914693.1 hypothetical protein [Gordonia amicalis]MCZ4579881.1 hypothetical protein [Gordonia amicalis]MCZ4654040.1 hypothetical protein [Gordonia amicalis]MDJ0455149.1 hypothetical protein [Gordonia amicalis]
MRSGDIQKHARLGVRGCYSRGFRGARPTDFRKRDVNPITSEVQDHRFFGPMTPFAAIGTLALAPLTWIVVLAASFVLYLLVAVVGGFLMFNGGKRRQIGAGIVFGSMAYVLVLVVLAVRLALGA